MGIIGYVHTTSNFQVDTLIKFWYFTQWHHRKYVWKGLRVILRHLLSSLSLRKPDAKRLSHNQNKQPQRAAILPAGADLPPPSDGRGNSVARRAARKARVVWSAALKQRCNGGAPQPRPFKKESSKKRTNVRTQLESLILQRNVAFVKTATPKSVALFSL